jgi:hypothetical protein
MSAAPRHGPRESRGDRASSAREPRTIAPWRDTIGRRESREDAAPQLRNFPGRTPPPQSETARTRRDETRREGR